MYCRIDNEVIPHTSCGTPPSVAAVLPVVNDFHQGAPRSRACSVSVGGQDRGAKGHEVNQHGMTRFPRKKKRQLTSCPVHAIRGTLIRAQEQNLFFAKQVDHILLDTRRLALNQQINDRIHILLKRQTRVGIKRGQDRALCSALRNLLILQMLRTGQRVVLVEQRTLVDTVRFAVPAPHDTDTATCDVAETHVKTAEFGTDDENDAVWLHRAGGIEGQKGKSFGRALGGTQGATHYSTSGKKPATR